MNSSDSSVLPRLLLGVAAGAAIGLGASDAAATVVTTDPPDITVAPATFIYFDPQSGYAGTTPLESPGVDAPFGLGFYAANSAKPQISTSTTTGFLPGQIFENASGYAPQISISTAISASTGTLAAVGSVAYLHNTTTGTTYPWVQGNHNFLAYAVPSNGSTGSAASGTTLYGWAEISYNTTNTLTLYRFGYDNSGAAVTTPPSLASVPEPGSLAAAAALGAAGLLAYRRRRAREQRGESPVVGAVAQA